MTRGSRRPFRFSEQGRDRFQTTLRIRFFQAVDKILPQVAQRLQDDVRSVFEPLALLLEQFEPWILSALLVPGLPGGSPGAAESMGYLTGTTSARLTSLADALEKQLLAWAEPHSLHRDPWILDHLCLVLQMHRRLHSGAPLRLGVEVPSARQVAPPVPPRPRWAGIESKLNPTAPWLALYAPVYHPAAETRADFMKRAREYANAVEAWYEERGGTEEPALQNLEVHMLWLARHQLQRIPYDKADPASKKRADASTVRRAIKALAQLLPLTLRPARGRPK